MVRLRSYRLECDSCGEAIDDGRAKEAEEFARRNGWLLRSKKHGDLCKACRRELEEKG